MSKHWQFAGQSEQRKAALKRKLDAEKLFRQGPKHCRGAMYLGGYAIECKLKAIAMERHDCKTLEALRAKKSLDENDVYSHGLQRLIKVLLPPGVLQRLLDGEARIAFVRYVSKWSPQWRYDGSDAPPLTALAFLDAVDTVWNWLEKNA